MAALNYIVGLIVFILAFRYAFSTGMVVKYPALPKGKKYYADNNLSFLLFSVATSMIFLGPLSLVKYGVWCVIMLILCLGRYTCHFTTPLKFYTLFILWCMYSMTYSQDSTQGCMMLVKYCLPFLYFFLGYNGINSRDDFIVFLKFTTIVGIIYAIVIGGLAVKLYAGVYNFLLWNSAICVGYAALADFFAAIICVPFVLYVLTRQTKYIYAAGFLFLSSVLDAVRTGIGGAVLASCVFFFVVYRFRALPYAIVAALSLTIAIYAVPEVHDKMFEAEINNTEISMDIGGQAIQMNGRNYTWEYVMNQCYRGHELTGSGLGTALSFFKGNSELMLIHSDYVQMLCEIGQIGLWLFIIFCVSVILGTLSTALSSTNIYVKLSGALAAGSLAGTLFCMGFDNVVTYAQQCFVIPFIMLGIYQKMTLLNKNRLL